MPDFPEDAEDFALLASLGHNTHRLSVEWSRIELAAARDDGACHALLEVMQHEVVDRYLASPGGDWLGVQYYRKQWVDPASPTWFGTPPPGTPVTQMGWAVHPDGLRQVVHRAARTRLPLIVTENGVATGDDTERIAHLDSHLRALAQARAEGADVRGYLHWSAFDNFEWSEGYRPKFGLIAVGADLARHPKPSAYAFARVARTGNLSRE